MIPTSGPWPPCAINGGGTAPASPAPPPAPAPDETVRVVIAHVHYDGAEFRREGDEYVIIRNDGSTPVNLRGWRLYADDRGQNFRFPDHVLEPGASCRVYTDEVHAETCGFSFNINRAIWNNGGDCAHLFDASGQLADKRCY